jgi:prepilin-type N-terminal cleavage/methylation domain-containing protein
MSKVDRAFTLLEVMAAVALLGILYTVLARVAIEGLRAEGESKRRLEASLLADARLEETFNTLEGSVAMPPVGHSEATEGDFTSPST